MGAVIWIFVAICIWLVGCDLLWVGGCWSIGLLWVVGVGCGVVNGLLGCCWLLRFGPVDGCLLLVGCRHGCGCGEFQRSGLEIVGVPDCCGCRRGCWDSGVLCGVPL